MIIMVRRRSIQCPATVEIVMLCGLLLTLINGYAVDAQTPIFTAHPQNVTARLGENVSLRCSMYPSAPVYWIVNGFPLISNASYDFKFNDVTGEHEIVIKNITMQRDGQYYCRSTIQGTGSKVVRSQDAHVTVIVPPTQIKLVPFSPVTIVQENFETSLTCSVSGGKPAPLVQWFKDDTAIEAGMDTQILTGDGTKIENVTSTLKWIPVRGDHEKRIYCTASHQALQGGPLRAETQLNVEYPPIVKVVSVPEVIKEGDAVTLQCIVDANPYFDLKFRWTKNGLPVTDSPLGSLHIDSAQRSERPVVYTCEATNRIGTNAANFQLDVQYPPVFYSMEAVKGADLNSDVLLICNVDSNPPAAITWTRDTSSKIIGTETVLRFRAASPTDFGVYVCQATAGANFPPVRKEVRVLQKAPPFISAEASVYAGQGETNVQIKCVINGLPVADTVRWTKTGGDPMSRVVGLRSDGHIEITQESFIDHVISHLIIKEVKKDDFGMYNCTAGNSYGTSDRLIPLKETDWMMPIIAGSACGGALLLVIIVVSAVFCIRCRSHNRLKEKASDTSGSTTTSDDLDIKSGNGVGVGEGGIHHHHHNNSHHHDLYTTTSNETLMEGKNTGWNGSISRQHHQQQDILHSHPYTIHADYTSNSNSHHQRKDGSAGQQNYYTRYADYDPNTEAAFMGLPAIYTPTLSITGEHCLDGGGEGDRDPSPYHATSGLPKMEPLYGGGGRYAHPHNGSVMVLDSTLNSRLATNV